MTLLIDNFDSFSYNLYQYIGELDPDITVIRNNEIDIDKIVSQGTERIIISPGPGRPEDAGDIIKVIRELGGKIPILGVCLGHQAICMAYGGVVGYAKRMMHGKQSLVKVDTDCALFAGCDEHIQVARYHSLAAEADTLPKELRVVAQTDDGEIMAVMHEDKHVYGVQFHPESIMTPCGKKILMNFMAIKAD
ncbi:MAG TPA: aminodeoxychorismate/anthranilate synthase component II [Eubacterium sp.]|nr:aminodeoxychorismate/anthranilate synthase component II [Eubacterium sp.]